MKILKIEIQNINSLKCKEPIVIDFKNEKFKDVGLYAITGTTGAGKTTILDAITIALYHQVARFNNSTSKNLSNVVSYGSKDAYVSVTFKNNEQIYESTWTMKMISPKGLKYQKPIEEVRLKNLTTGFIEGEKKGEIKNKIFEIIQLGYKQFLRSVLLAQGDFASFLSAKGADKAKLLEQITGEQIYKKIGEAILHKKSTAQKKLKDILLEFEIHSKDLLSDDEKEELNKDKNDINEKLSKLIEEQKQNEKIQDWFKKNTDLKLKIQDLKLELVELDKKKNIAKNSLESLSLHKKAEPFKDIIKEIKRLKAEIAKKQTIITTLTDNLTNVTANFEKYSIKTKKLNQEYKAKDDDFKKWLPKLETVLKYDNKLENDIAKLKEFDANIGNYNKKISTLNFENKKLTKSLNTDKESFDNEFLIPKDYNNIENISSELLNFKKQEESIKQYIDSKNVELDNLIKFLKENNLENLQEEISNIQSDGEKWRNLEKYSTEFIEKSKILLKDNSKKLKIKKEQSELEIKISSQIKDVEIASSSYKDYIIIYNQKLKIHSFEEERKLLKKGEECKLCGSKDHPYINHYNEKEFSESEKELSRRKEKYELLKENLQKIKINLVEKKAEIDTIKNKINQLEEDIKIVQNNTKKLVPDIKIEDIEFIKAKIQETLIEYNKCNNKINKSNNKTIQKDKLIHELSLLNEFKTNIVSLKENFEEKLLITNKTKTITNSIKTLENERNKILSIETSVENKRKQISEDLNNAKKAFEENSEKLKELQINKLNLETEINTHKREIDKLTISLEKENNSLERTIEGSIFSTKDDVFNALLTNEEYSKIIDIKKYLDNKTIELNTITKTLEKDEKDLKKQKDFETTIEEVESILNTIKIEISGYHEKIGEISEKIRKNKIILERNKGVQSKIERQEKIVGKWSKLMEIIGGNQYSLNAYVQRLTLQHLISLANFHLKKLNNRYSLKIKTDNTLDFNLIDHFQLDETRDVNTSSGGEKFLISLSLALGLSDLASNNVKIESLFIDEGFGSLDSNTLETAISALETLQTQGKMIGIISHVESLKERIPTQINVVKKNNGVSIVEM